MLFPEEKSHFFNSDLNRINADNDDEEGQKDDDGDDYGNHLDNEDIADDETMTMKMINNCAAVDDNVATDHDANDEEENDGCCSLFTAQSKSPSLYRH